MHTPRRAEIVAVKTILYQVGALPYRKGINGDVEVLLITTRRSRKWSIPKGWPMNGKTDPEAAMREAYEEAGLLGQISDMPLGSFSYKKVSKDGLSTSTLNVTVYAMLVERQLAYWPEARQRTMAWVSPESALDLVANKSLSQLIKRLVSKALSNCECGVLPL